MSKLSKIPLLVSAIMLQSGGAYAEQPAEIMDFDQMLGVMIAASEPIVLKKGAAYIKPADAPADESALPQNPEVLKQAEPPAKAARVPLLTNVTDSWIKQTKWTKSKSFAMLDQMNDEAGLPKGTLPTLWVAESMAGKLNVRNRHGYVGHFQIGDYEKGKYCPKGTSRRNLKDAATCTINLLKDYSKKSGIELDSVLNAYSLHNQGFNGAKKMRQTAETGAPLRGTVLRNMRSNTFKRIKQQLWNSDGSPKGGAQEVAKGFMMYWDSELDRILEGLGYTTDN